MTTTLAPVCDKYELLQKLGEGGMAQVYRARHRSTGEMVAIKVAAPEVASDSVHRQRFEQEYRVASKLRHPAIVRALGFGESEAGPYIVMELVDGQDLWSLVEERGRLPEAEAVGIITQIAQGLHEAHQQGIIHRDVKPDNVLVTANGIAKLTDLGLVKDLDAELDLTRTRKGLGTPNFMAPEQFGDAKRVGVASDVYSLGATLYMAVTGEMPFAGKAVGVILKKKLNNELRGPRELVRSLSERVDLAIRRAMRADPQQRQSTCLEFVKTLTEDDAPGEGARPAASGGAQGLDAFFPPAPSVERRAWVRYPCLKQTACDILTSIHPGDEEAKDSWQATVVNLSTRGVGLLVNRRFEPNTTITVLLESRNRSVSRSLEVRVTRVQQPRGTSGWLLGGRFVTPLTKEELQRLL